MTGSARERERSGDAEQVQEGLDASKEDCSLARRGCWQQSICCLACRSVSSLVLRVHVLLPHAHGPDASKEDCSLARLSCHSFDAMGRGWVAMPSVRHECRPHLCESAFQSPGPLRKAGAPKSGPQIIFDPENPSFQMPVASSFIRGSVNQVKSSQVFRGN